MTVKKRVVVTGVGVVSPAGIGVAPFWDAIVQGKSTVRAIATFDPTPFPTRIASAVADKLILPDLLKRNLFPYMEARFAQMAVLATLEALSMARLEEKDFQGDPMTSILVGSSKGGMELYEQAVRGDTRIIGNLLAAASINAAALAIQKMLSVGGSVGAMVTACATGAHAIGEGYRLIQQGKARRVIAGSGEATITPLMLGAFSQLKALSRRNDDPQGASRPFDRDRDGFVMGEGSGIVILESLESALARGADPLFEIAGYGNSSDAFHATHPDMAGEGMTLAMKKALSDAAIMPGDVDYINAHGTSTISNDLIETIAIKKVLGKRSYSMPVSSIKSTLGHLMGAAGSIELISTGLSVRNGLIPPTINLKNPADDCDLDYVSEGFRQRDINIALSNSFGFGGHNAVLVVKKGPAGFPVGRISELMFCHKGTKDTY